MDISSNLHNIMNGALSKNSVDMEIDKGDNEEEEHSLAKKRGGSSKSSKKCNYASGLSSHARLLDFPTHHFIQQDYHLP